MTYIKLEKLMIKYPRIRIMYNRDGYFYAKLAVRDDAIGQFNDVYGWGKSGVKAFEHLLSKVEYK